MPEVGGHGGHPAVIPFELVAAIVSQSTPGGLREFWRANPELCKRIPVEDPGCIRDLDTPVDYQRHLPSD
jgi:CTP:molybdopterin cytidylyltransferase MocA